MSKSLLGLTLLVVAIITLVAAVFAYRFGDAERLREPLEAYFSERTGLPVRIEGELAWQFFPPLQLSITNLTAGVQDAKRRGSLDAAALRIAPLSALRAPNEPSRWTISAFTLGNLQYVDGPRHYEIVQFEIHNLKDRTSAPFSTALTYDNGRPNVEGISEPETLNLAGSMLLATNSLSMTFSDVTVSGSMAEGECDANFALAHNAATQTVASSKDDLVPVADLRDTRWQTDCVFNSVRWNNQDFTDATLFSTNNSGATRHRLNIADFFSGTAQIDLSVDASLPKVRWQLEPKFTAVDSTKLFAWLDQSSRWQGPINLDGEISFQGNNAASFLFTGKGELNINSDNGTFDIRDVKQQVKGIGKLIGKQAKVDDWPDDLNYQSFSAHWVMQGAEHQIAALLDNLKISAAGNYQIVADEMDIDAELTFVSNTQPKPLPVSAMLEDIPIPMRCQGSIAAPACSIDNNAGRDIIGDILSGKGGNTALRKKLDTVIEEEVPERYRDAARQLLDLLGDTFGGSTDSGPQPEAKPQEQTKTEQLPEDDFGAEFDSEAEPALEPEQQ